MWAYGLNGITLGALDHDGLSLMRVRLGTLSSMIYPQTGILIGDQMHLRPEVSETDRQREPWLAVIHGRDGHANPL
jgi:hypothetical protein